MDVFTEQLAELRGLVKEGFAAERRLNDARHRENREDLREIKEQVRLTNGSVSDHESRITRLEDQPERTTDDAKAPITRGMLALWIGMVLSAIYATWWVLTVLAGFHK